MTELDAAMLRARRVDALFTELCVGVIGEAGVGKSTLINALLSERLPLLPQGGVGPLTAAPIELRYAADPYVRVACHGRARVEDLMEAVASDSTAPGISAPVRATLSAERQLARLLAAGSQFTELHPSALLGFLRACMGSEAPNGDTNGLLERLQAARAVVACGESTSPFLEVSAGLDLPKMLATINAHSAGFLAPLSAALEIGWDAACLREDVVLIDLPGLGVANDQYRQRTAATVRRIDVVLLVVDRSGLSQATMDLLESSGVLERVLRGDGQAPTLLVAVSKLDQPIADAVVAHKQAMRGAIRWSEVAPEYAARACQVVAAQLTTELARRERAPSANLGSQLRIMPVLPRDYQRLHRAEPDEPTQLRSAEESGIPALARAIEQLARERRIDLVALCREALNLVARTEPQAVALHEELQNIATHHRGPHAP